MSDERPGRAATATLEQGALRFSIAGVLAIAAGSMAWGLWIDSEVVILNGVLSLFSLVGAGLSLLAAKLVARPEDRRFPFGYSQVEPVVLTVNGFMLLVICVYAFINGVEGIRAGGREVDPGDVMWFGAVSGLVCLVVWVRQSRSARRLGSTLVMDDAREWLVDAGFSLATLVGFAVLPLLEEPLRGTWARYADPAMVSVLALAALPVPITALRRSLKEVLMMAREDDEVARRIDAVMAQIAAEHDVIRYVPHVVKNGRTYFIEIDIVVGPAFALQTVPQQDTLRARIWDAIGQPRDAAWLSVALTADPRWV